MAIRVQRHANVSKQATLLDGLDVRLFKWRVCWCGLNRFVHEGMNHISNVKVHLKTPSRNVNISKMSRGLRFPTMWHFDMCRLRRLTSLGSHLLSLETPNGVQSVA